MVQKGTCFESPLKYKRGFMLFTNFNYLNNNIAQLTCMLLRKIVVISIII